MARIAYVNGTYVSTRDALVHINDRGFQFADGVYEGISVRRGNIIDLEAHLDRLWRSLGELAITPPMDRGPLRIVLGEVIRRNLFSDAFVYIQITRGVAARDHAIPSGDIPASLIVTCKRLNFDDVKKRALSGVAGTTQPDIRWGRCDVKSTGLLPNILAKQAARETGAFEAILVDDDGYITEGSSTNIWVVTEGGDLVTRPTTDNILAGITRARLKIITEKLKIGVKEAKISVEDAKKAREIFLTSATSCATPIIKLDGQKIGDGTVGPVAKRLIEAYFQFTDV